MRISSLMGRIHVGCSGWVYDHWKRIFYPEKMPARAWLPYYAQHFSCVELNFTFYRLPPEGAAERWAADVPADFRFAVKGSRYLTHMRKLLDRELGVARFFERIAGLGHKRGPILWQLPPRFHVLPDRLDGFLGALPKGPHAVEIRDESWFTPEVFAVLRRRHAALVVHDNLKVRWPWPPPGSFVYWRFHGTTGRYEGRYGRRRLRTVASRLRDLGCDSWVFFNNDQHGHAIMDALDLLDLLGQPAATSARRASALAEEKTSPTNGSGRPSL